MRVLALDLMGVIAVQQFVDLSKVTGNEADADWKRKSIAKVQEACAGGLTEREMAEAIGITPGQLQAAVDSVECDEDAKALVRTAKKKGWTTCLLSNHIDRWARYLLEKFEVELDRLVVSSAVKSRKPDARIFEEALRVTGAKPNEVLFVDDKARNLEAARELGFECVLMDRGTGEGFEPSVRRLGEVAGML